MDCSKNSVACGRDILSWTIAASKLWQLWIFKRRAKLLLGRLVQADNFQQADQACNRPPMHNLCFFQAAQHELQLAPTILANEEGIKERTPYNDPLRS